MTLCLIPVEWHLAGMVEIQPLQIQIEREEDGRFLASVPELPGVMAYGDTEESALRKAKTIALQVLADMVESGEELQVLNVNADGNFQVKVRAS